MDHRQILQNKAIRDLLKTTTALEFKSLIGSEGGLGINLTQGREFSKK